MYWVGASVLLYHLQVAETQSTFQHVRRFLVKVGSSTFCYIGLLSLCVCVCVCVSLEVTSHQKNAFKVHLNDLSHKKGTSVLSEGVVWGP